MFSLRNSKWWLAACLLAGAGALVLSGTSQTGFAQMGGAHSQTKMQGHEGVKADQKATPKQKSLYLLDNCPVSGQKLDAMGGPIDYKHDGQTIKLCCKGCIKKFEAEPKKYLKKIDEAIAKKQIAQYPLENCLISGSKLGGMGKPIDHFHEGRLVRFCCAGCIKKFQSSPATHLKKMDEMIVAKGIQKYMPVNCLVSKEKLGGKMGKPIDLVYDNQLVRLCCKGCVRDFNKDTNEYMGMLGKAQKAKKSGAHKAVAKPAHDHSSHGAHN